MKRLIYIYLVCFGLAVHGQVMWQLKGNEVKKWYYVGGDEFNDQYVDRVKWGYNAPWGGALPEQKAVFVPENTYLENGLAHLVVKKERVQGHIYPWELDSAWARKNHVKVENETMWFDYTLGQFFSKIRYKYGYFECRFKANEERGCWPAFWLFAGEPNNEIDWFEIKGERKKQFHVDVHCPTGCDDYRGGFLNMEKNWGGWVKTDRSLAQEYNVISGEWDPEYMIWYLNGKPVAWFRHHFDISMWLIVGTGLASDNAAFGPGPDKTTKFPNEVVLDYVRVWGKQDTASKNRQTFLLSDNTMKGADVKHISKAKKLKFVYKKSVLDAEKGSVTLLPIGKNLFSLTFNCAAAKEAKIELLAESGKKVKEFTLTDPYYYTFDLSGIPGGDYLLKINIHGIELTTNLTVEK